MRSSSSCICASVKFFLFIISNFIFPVYHGDRPSDIIFNYCTLGSVPLCTQIERNTKQKSLFLFLFPRCSHCNATLCTFRSENFRPKVKITQSFPNHQNNSAKIREICGICATKSFRTSDHINAEMRKVGKRTRNCRRCTPQKVCRRCFLLCYFYRFLMTLQGLPTATVFDGISLTTTEPAPMVTLLPMVTPGRMVTLPPIHTLWPMVTGFAHS